MRKKPTELLECESKLMTFVYENMISPNLAIECALRCNERKETVKELVRARKDGTMPLKKMTHFLRYYFDVEFVDLTDREYPFKDMVFENAIVCVGKQYVYVDKHNDYYANKDIDGKVVAFWRLK